MPEISDTVVLGGHLFETAVVIDVLKARSVIPAAPALHFFRTAQDLKADVRVDPGDADSLDPP
ncbi:MAG: hypothetical protein JNJ88_14105 [Planctomycetes bacterium]|nr:hypothetical protein [Planctomycetota bacterium]